jgi:hypothetical protein
MRVSEDAQRQDSIGHDAIGTDEEVPYALGDDSKGSLRKLDVMDAGVSPNGR